MRTVARPVISSQSLTRRGATLLAALLVLLSVASRASAFLRASASGHSGCCAAGNIRQDAGAQEALSGWLVTAPG